MSTIEHNEQVQTQTQTTTNELSNDISTFFPVNDKEFALSKDEIDVDFLSSLKKFGIADIYVNKLESEVGCAQNITVYSLNEHSLLK